MTNISGLEFRYFSGYIVVPAGIGAFLIGGYLIKRFNLGMKGILRLCIGVSIPCIVTLLIFLVNCTNEPFAGVNINYNDARNG